MQPTDQNKLRVVRIADLCQQFPMFSEAEVRKALNFANGQVAEAALVLRGKSAQVVASRRGIVQREPTRYKPLTVAEQRRRKHLEVSRYRSDAMSDLLM